MRILSAPRNIAARAGFGLCLLMLCPQLAAAGPTIILTDEGIEHAGSILDVTVTTLTLKRANTGYSMIPLHEIDTVRIDIDDGEAVEGRLVDWQDGLCTLLVGDRFVSVKDNVIVNVTSAISRPGSREPTEAPFSVDEGQPPSAAPRPLAPDPLRDAPAGSRVTM